jgi:hypothetical protein
VQAQPLSRLDLLVAVDEIGELRGDGVHRHQGEAGENAHAIRRAVPDEGDIARRRDHREGVERDVASVLVEELELLGSGADAESVKDDLLPGVLDYNRCGLSADQAGQRDVVHGMCSEGSSAGRRPPARGASASC